MAKKIETAALEPSTEEKIRSAARQVFHQKGFASTRTRDIAEVAGINLALLNYYFRSKEKLFELVMLDTFQEFILAVAPIFNDEATVLAQKIEKIAVAYIDLYIAHPDIPMFLLQSVKNQPEEFFKKMGVKDMIMQSVLLRQFVEGIQNGSFPTIHPLHFMMNLMGLIGFPFLAKPVMMGLGNMNDGEFEEMMQQRKSLIPMWIKTMLSCKDA